MRTPQLKFVLIFLSLQSTLIACVINSVIDYAFDINDINHIFNETIPNDYLLKYFEKWFFKIEIV